MLPVINVWFQIWTSSKIAFCSSESQSHARGDVAPLLTVSSIISLLLQISSEQTILDRFQYILIYSAAHFATNHEPIWQLVCLVTCVEQLFFSGYFSMWFISHSIANWSFNSITLLIMSVFSTESISNFSEPQHPYQKSQ